MTAISAAAGDFKEPLDIANRGLQHLGARRITSFTEDSKNANTVRFCYDKLRKSELRRAVWEFAIKKAVLRPIDTTTGLLTPAAYDATKTYVLGAIISYGGSVYQARGNVPLATTPDTNPDLWMRYFGTMSVSIFDNTIAYFAGDLVYVAGSTVVYLSLASSNSDVPSTVPAYDPTITYNIGDTVTQSAVVYQSTTDFNIGHTPTGTAPWVVVPVTQPVQMMGQRWLKLDASLAALRIIYPVGTGPSSQAFTRNIYLLPNGWLRPAPQDPKAGNFSWLGAPSGGFVSDWLYEGGYLISAFSEAILYRFAADMTNVLDMDPMFCERLAARIAVETCEDITQSSEKLQTMTAMYKKFGEEAIEVNAIVKESEEPPEDDYIACRV